MKKIFLVLFIIGLGCGKQAFMIADDTMIKIAVFCSADDKVSALFKQVAYNLGVQLGTHNFGLITGGSRTGLMKEVIDGYVTTAISCNDLYGVLPQALITYDVHHRSILPNHIKWTDSIYTRLATFHALADVIVILPGGFGTLHELMDFLVHTQFALSKKPIILINPDGYWDHLLLQFKTMVASSTVTEKHLAVLSVVTSEDACVEILMGKKLVTVEQGLSDRYWERA